jgi:peptide/nickel transport system permease protein
MLSFVARRFFYMLPILFVVTVIIFLLMYFQPGTIVDKLCGLVCPKEQREALEKKYGLDQPFHVQYLKWLEGVLPIAFKSEPPFIASLKSPDFGWSPGFTMPAWQALVGENRWIYTLLLVLVSMVISWVIAVPIGIYSATHKYSPADHTFTFLGFLGLSIPNFILGLLFFWVVVGIIKIGHIDPFFQVGGFLNPDLHGKPIDLKVVLNFLWHFLPPVFILAAANTAAIIRYMRGSLLDVLDMEYVQTARAKGLTERIVIYKHAVRNAINPLISMLGFWIPYMLEGALIIAIIFNLPQIEKTFIQSIENRDSTVVMAGLFVFSVILLIGNLISDILLALSDPKIRYD